MADNQGELLQDNAPEKAEVKSGLERKHGPEVSHEKIEHDVEKLAERGEKAKAEIAKEAKIEKEKTEADQARKSEKTKEKAEKGIEKPVAGGRKSVRKQAYKKELKKVRSQLSPTARTFSKVIHNTVVDGVSVVAEQTVLRPSAMIGGAVLGVLLGGLLYLSARLSGYIIPNWSLLGLLVIGGVCGVIIEFLLKATTPKAKP